MQPISWYAWRLRAMEPGEALLRLRCTARDAVDQYLRPLRELLAARQICKNGRGAASPGYKVSNLPVGYWSRQDASATERAWASGLRIRASRILSGRLCLFDLQDCDVGQPVDWNRNPKGGIATPTRFAPWIDYRDYRVVGDCKFIWELNRHHHLVVLARAYRATGDLRYARAVVGQLEQWLDQCPYGVGMNWRSPLELAIRLINWVWALDLIFPSGLLSEPFFRRLLHAVYLHLWEVSRKYSQGSSANNHRIGEAAGTYIAARYFRGLLNAPLWEAEGSRILREEILRQTFADGCTREQALGYHLFALQFFALAGIVARRTGADFPAEYWERLWKMFAFVSALMEGGDALPMFGDCDDGYVLDLDADPHDVRPWLAVGSALFGDPGFDPESPAGGCPQALHWLPDAALRETYGALERVQDERSIRSQAFADSGYYLLQCGRRDGLDRISVLFDCGPLGFGRLAAHGHADALSFTLRAFGQDVLVDPGTFDYFTYPQWRSHFRGTSAHNAVVMDHADQSVQRGLFLWTAKARARCLAWRPTEQGGRVCGEHDGYRRFASPVIHRRTLDLDGGRREVLVVDQLLTDGQHDYAVYFQLAEQCRASRVGRNRFEVQVGFGRVTLVLDERLRIETLCGSDSPMGGWVSRGYHRKSPSTTIVGRCSHRGRLLLRTRIKIGRPAEGVE